MSFLQITLLGVRLWVWLYLLFAVCGLIAVLVIFYKELIKKKYYDLRFPEKVVKIVVHYKGNMFKEFFRLIPDSDEFIIEGKRYQFHNKDVLKENDFFIKGTPPNTTIKVDGDTYNFNNLYQLKNRWKKYTEIHYFYNSPIPLDFDLGKKTIEFSSKQLQDFKENDLFAKLLTMDTEKALLKIMLIAVVINMLVSGVILAKIMEWI